MKALKPSEIVSNPEVELKSVSEIIIAYLNSQLVNMAKRHGTLVSGMEICEDIWPLKLSHCSKEERQNVIDEFESAGYKVSVSPFHSFIVRDIYRIKVI